MASLASNRSTSPQVLSMMARNEDFVIRRLVASNPSAPWQALSRLAQDTFLSIREAVASNPSAAPQTLSNLAGTNNNLFYALGLPATRIRVAGNPSAPPQVLSYLSNLARIHETRYTGSPFSFDIRRQVASNPSAPSQVLSKLARDREHYVRQQVASNPSTPTNTLVEMSLGDSEPEVRTKALSEIRRRKKAMNRVFEVILHTTGSNIVPTRVSTLAKVEKQPKPKPKRPNAATRGPKPSITKGLTPSQQAFADKLSESVREAAKRSAREAASMKAAANMTSRSKKDYLNWIKKHHNKSDPYWQLVARAIKKNE